MYKQNIIVVVLMYRKYTFSITFCLVDVCIYQHIFVRYIYIIATRFPLCCKSQFRYVRVH